MSKILNDQGAEEEEVSEEDEVHRGVAADSGVGEVAEVDSEGGGVEAASGEGEGAEDLQHFIPCFGIHIAPADFHFFQHPLDQIWKGEQTKRSCRGICWT